MDKKLENGITRIAKSMVSAVTNSSLYSEEHAQVKRHLQKTHECIHDLLKTRDNVSFVVIEGELVVDNHPMTADIFLSKFAEKLQKKNIGGLTFTKGVSEEELLGFVKTLSSQTTEDHEIVSTPNIKIGRVEIKTKGRARMKNAGYSIGTQEMMEFMEIYMDMEKTKKLDVNGMFTLISNIVRALHKERNPLRALAPMKSFNEYTFTHSINVCILAISQAMALGFEGQMLHDIGIAALLHDVGKLFIPDEILSKDEKLTEKEWEIIREHPAKGAVYLMDIAGISDLSVVIAFEHHMLYDSSGYPKVKTGWAQNICSQITTLADVFDAMRTYKTYREAFAEKEIFELIVKKTGKEYNPFLVENFIKTIKMKQ